MASAPSVLLRPASAFSPSREPASADRVGHLAPAAAAASPRPGRLRLDRSDECVWLAGQDHARAQGIRAAAPPGRTSRPPRHQERPARRRLAGRLRRRRRAQGRGPRDSRRAGRRCEGAAHYSDGASPRLSAYRRRRFSIDARQRRRRTRAPLRLLPPSRSQRRGPEPRRRARSSAGRHAPSAARPPRARDDRRAADGVRHRRARHRQDLGGRRLPRRAAARLRRRSSRAASASSCPARPKPYLPFLDAFGRLLREPRHAGAR